jgi:hypothetical protein
VVAYGKDWYLSWPLQQEDLVSRMLCEQVATLGTQKYSADTWAKSSTHDVVAKDDCQAPCQAPRPLDSPVPRDVCGSLSSQSQSP